MSRQQHTTSHGRGTDRYLTSEEAADYLRIPTVAALRAFLYRRRKDGRAVKTHRMGRKLLFRTVDLDAALAVERPRR